MSPNPISPNQQKVLALITAGLTATAAAKQAGVHRNTIGNWLDTEQFKEALQAARAQKELLYWDQAEALVALAIANLIRLMYDSTISAAARVKATVALFDHAMAFLPNPGAIVLPNLDEIVHKSAQPPAPEEPPAESPEPDEPPADPPAEPPAEPPVETPAQPTQVPPAPEIVHNNAQSPAPGQRARSLRTGRNDLCPCGSGLKFKRCCAKRDNLNHLAVPHP